MTYEEIISENKARHSRIPWWPEFAFHYTNVDNAASILETGYLYSRTRAEAEGVMQNDNASYRVIDATKAEVLGRTRFYFRPLTPTQYHNEGFKAQGIRYDRKGANVPVPVFFVFDLAALLKRPGVMFSGTSQAGHGAQLESGPEAFSRLNFDQIYSHGTLPPGEEGEREKKARHAEILGPAAFPIASCLRFIVCRNEVERLTLLTLLEQRGKGLRESYEKGIRIAQDATMFYRNGLFVDSAAYYNGALKIVFADTPARYDYLRRNPAAGALPVRVKIGLQWGQTEAASGPRWEYTYQMDYRKAEPCVIRNLPQVAGAQWLLVTVCFDGKLMCKVPVFLEKAGFM